METLTVKSSKIDLSVEKIMSMTISKPTDIILIDPCYVFDHSDKQFGKELDKAWQEHCDLIFPEGYENLPNEQKLYSGALMTYKGAKILMTGTAFGDGSYFVDVHNLSKIGDCSGVDSGSLAFITLEDVKKINPNFLDLMSGVIIKGFSGTLEVDGEGNLFGYDNQMNVVLSCYTDNQKEDREDEEEW